MFRRCRWRWGAGKCLQEQLQHQGCPPYHGGDPGWNPSRLLCGLFLPPVPPHSRTSCQPLKVPQMVHFSQKGNLRCRRCPRVPGHWTWETRPGEWRCQSSSEPAQPLRAAGGQANSGIVRAAGCRDARQPFPLARLGSPSGGKGQIGQKCAREWRAQPQGMRRSTCLA